MLKTSVGMLVFVMVCLVWWKAKSRGSIQGLSILPLPNTKLRKSAFRHGFGIQDKLQRTTLTGKVDGIRRYTRKTKLNDTSQKGVLPQTVGIRYKPERVISRKNGGTIRRYAHKADKTLGERISPLAVGFQDKLRQTNDTEKSYDEKTITKELHKESPEHLFKQAFDIQNDKTQRTLNAGMALAKRRSNQTSDKTSQEPVLKHSLGIRTKTHMPASKRKGDDERKLTKEYHNKSYETQAFNIQNDKTQMTSRKGKKGNGERFTKRFHYKSQAPVILQDFGLQSNSQKATGIWKDGYGQRANGINKNSQKAVLPLAFGIQNKPQRNPGIGMVDIGRRFTMGVYNKSQVPVIQHAFGFQIKSRKRNGIWKVDDDKRAIDAHNNPQQPGVLQAFGIQNKPQRETDIGMVDNGRRFAKQSRNKSQVPVIPQAFGFQVKSRKATNIWEGDNSQMANDAHNNPLQPEVPQAFGIQNKPQRKAGFGMVDDGRRW